jgi:hypothetical protein
VLAQGVQQRQGAADVARVVRQRVADRLPDGLEAGEVDARRARRPRRHGRVERGLVAQVALDEHEAVVGGVDAEQLCGRLGGCGER